MNNKERIYSIENISEKQLMVIKKSLDIFSRLNLLQFENAIPDEIRFNPDFNCHINIEKITELLDDVKKYVTQNHNDFEVRNIGLYKGASFGIGQEHVDNNANIAYELYKSIAKNIWLNESEDIKKHYSVDAYDGLQITDESRIIIKSKTVREIKLKNILKNK